MQLLLCICVLFLMNGDIEAGTVHTRQGEAPHEVDMEGVGLPRFGDSGSFVVQLQTCDTAQLYLLERRDGYGAGIHLEQGTNMSYIVAFMGMRHCRDNPLRCKRPDVNFTVNGDFCSAPLSIWVRWNKNEKMLDLGEGCVVGENSFFSQPFTFWRLFYTYSNVAMRSTSNATWKYDHCVVSNTASTWEGEDFIFASTGSYGLDVTPLSHVGSVVFKVQACEPVAFFIVNHETSGIRFDLEPKRDNSSMVECYEGTEEDQCWPDRYRNSIEPVEDFCQTAQPFWVQWNETIKTFKFGSGCVVGENPIMEPFRTYYYYYYYNFIGLASVGNATWTFGDDVCA